MLPENIHARIVELRYLLSNDNTKKRYSEAELAAMRDELSKLTKITKNLVPVRKPEPKNTFNNHT